MKAPLVRLRAVAALAALTFKVPFPCGQAWSGQARTNHSPANAIDLNQTIDLGDPVVAIAPGTVGVVTDLGNTSYGRYVRINHGGGYTTYCAHLNGFDVSVGQSVRWPARRPPSGLSSLRMLGEGRYTVVRALSPGSIVTLRGVQVNTRTREMLLQAERLLGRELGIPQGSYNFGVGASAGTHDDGALDLSASGPPSATRTDVPRRLRTVGFAARNGLADRGTDEGPAVSPRRTWEEYRWML